MARHTPFIKCPECGERGKPVKMKYGQGYICKNMSCKVIYYGDKA